MTKDKFKQTFGESASGPSLDDQIVGERLRTLRKLAKWSLADMGDFIGVSFQQVQKYETAQNKLPLVKAAEIVNQFGLSLDYFNPKQAGLFPLTLALNTTKIAVVGAAVTTDRSPT